jgi:hypothetical protein
MARALGWVARMAVSVALGALAGCAIPIFGARPAGHAEPREGTVALRERWSDPGARARREQERSPEACFARLHEAGVAFDRVSADEAAGVRMPLRLRGPIGGVTVVPSDKRAVHAILDCRLALALLSWSEILQRAGVERIEHYSMYRPGARVAGSGHMSGHARGLAIDAARFRLRTGAVVDVQSDWEERDHGPPCPLRSDEAWPSRLLRGLVCDAVQRNLFQIVITPNHDRAHENHVHLERKPEVSWTYVR